MTVTLVHGVRNNSGKRYYLKTPNLVKMVSLITNGILISSVPISCLVLFTAGNEHYEI